MDKNITETPEHSIAIGDGAVAEKHNELTIKVNGYSGSVILTDAEYKVFHDVFKRMKFKKDN